MKGRKGNKMIGKQYFIIQEYRMISPALFIFEDYDDAIKWMERNAKPPIKRITLFDRDIIGFTRELKKIDIKELL